MQMRSVLALMLVLFLAACSSAAPTPTRVPPTVASAAVSMTAPAASSNLATSSATLSATGVGAATMSANPSGMAATQSTTVVGAMIPCPPGTAMIGATLSATMDTGMSVAGMLPTMPPTQMAGAKGYIGVQLEAVDNCGVRVTRVEAAGSAETANIQVGDVIVAIDGIPVASLSMMGGMGGTMSATMSANAAATMAANTGAMMSATMIADTSGLVQAFLDRIANTPPGTVIMLTVQRAGSQMDVAVTVGAQPTGGAETMPAATGVATVTR